jgi:hypothetical protein
MRIWKVYAVILDQPARDGEAAKSRWEALCHAVDRVDGFRVAKFGRDVAMPNNNAVGQRMLFRQWTERWPKHTNLVPLEIPITFNHDAGRYLTEYS